MGTDSVNAPGIINGKREQGLNAVVGDLGTAPGNPQRASPRAWKASGDQPQPTAEVERDVA